MLNKGLYSKFRPNPGNRTGRQNRNRSKKNQNEVWETKSRIFVPKNRIFFCWCLCWNFISSFFFGGLVSKLPPFSRIPKNTISFKFRKQPKWKIFYSIEQKASKHEVELICSNFFSGIWFFWQESFSLSSVHWTILMLQQKRFQIFISKFFCNAMKNIDFWSKCSFTVRWAPVVEHWTANTRDLGSYLPYLIILLL